MAKQNEGDSEFNRLKAGGVWKGENESDAELLEGYEINPLANAGAWTEDEAYHIYREKLVNLRDLYLDQLGHMNHVLKEKRREFLLQDGGNRMQASQPSHGGTLEDAAYRCYRKRSGEEALLEQKRKQRRIMSSLDFFLKRDSRDLNKAHYQYLLKLHHQHGSPVQPPCASHGCDSQCLPFASRCSRHMCDDQKQHLYIKCSYMYPSGSQCSKPVPCYMNPPLCGGHCDNISPPSQPTKSESTSDNRTLTADSDDQIARSVDSDMHIQR